MKIQKYLLLTVSLSNFNQTFSMKPIDFQLQELTKKLKQSDFENEEILKRIKSFIKAGADVNRKDPEGYNLLMGAAWTGNFDFAKILIEADANVNEIDKDGNTPLILTTAYDFDLNLPTQEEIDKRNAITELLIKAGANINVQNKAGNTALNWVVQNKFYKIAKTLILNGANINLNSPLVLASTLNQIDLIELFIKNNVNVNCKDTRGYTALLAAAQEGHDNIVKLLLNTQGVNIFLKNRNNKTALDLAKNIIINSLIREKIVKIGLLRNTLFDSIKSANYKAIKDLATKSSFGVYDINKNNPLHLAVILSEKTQEEINNKLEIIKLILRIRKDLISQKNDKNLTPIELALGTGNFKVLELFIDLAIANSLS